MKKILSLAVLLVTVILLSACSGRQTLYLLNWGEYINEDLITAFEEEFNVRVSLDTADSNEIMYTRIKNRTTRYDVAIPSDYMIEKLYNEGLLIELDRELLPNYQASRFDVNLQALRDDLFVNNQNYAVPYFFGTLGIMYNTAKAGVEELVQTHGWAVLFDRTIIGEDIKVGMYNSSRDAIAAAALYLGYSLNTTNDTELAEIEAALSTMRYDTYGTDDLKRKIAEQNLDIALVYSGDFFDQLYGTMEDELEVTYNMFVPNENNLWFDGMVIPSTSRNVELAHQFINFMIEEGNAYENAAYVGYAPTITSVFEALQDDEDYAEIIEDYPYYPITDPETFNGEVYRDLGAEIYQKMELLFQRSKN